MSIQLKYFKIHFLDAQVTIQRQQQFRKSIDVKLKFLKGTQKTRRAKLQVIPPSLEYRAYENPNLTRSTPTHGLGLNSTIPICQLID